MSRPNDATADPNFIADLRPSARRKKLQLSARSEKMAGRRAEPDGRAEVRA